MRYVQYYEHNMSGKLCEAMGDRSVVILDGRNNLENSHIDAVKFNGFRRDTYPAYKLMEGDSFTRSHSISKLIILDKGIK